MSLDRLERPPLVSRSVQNAIRDFVITERLQPGDALPPETELARQLGVGRNSVREAVKALESLGVLEVRRGSGLYVRDFSLEPLLDSLPYVMMSDVEDLADVFEVRRILEVGVMDKAMETMSPHTVERLRTITERMRAQAEQGKAFEKEDREFHRLLFQHMNNKTLLTLLDAFWLVFCKAALHTKIQDPNPMNTYRDHAAILAAIEAGDVAAARQALARHYDGLQGRLHYVQEEREGVAHDDDLPVHRNSAA
jgi:DNA-binding FadR family transcriptional regulator